MNRKKGRFELMRYLFTSEQEMLEAASEDLGRELVDSWSRVIMIESVPSFFDMEEGFGEDLVMELPRKPFYLNLNPWQSLLLFEEGSADFRLVARQIYISLKRSHTARMYLGVSREIHGGVELPRILRELEQLMEEQYYHSEAHVVAQEEDETPSSNDEAQDSRLIQLISEDVSRKDLTRLRRHFGVLSEKYSEHNRFSAMYIKFVFSSVLQELFQEPRFARIRRLEQQIDRLYTCTNMAQILEITRQEIAEYGLFLERALSQSRKEVAAVCNYIRESYAQDLSVEAMAELVNMPEGYLSYLFRTETGKGIKRYVMDVRMKESARLLRTTDRRMPQIGLQTGFHNTEYFSSSFYTFFGLEASEYRLKTRQLPETE